MATRVIQAQARHDILDCHTRAENPYIYPQEIEECSDAQETAQGDLFGCEAAATSSGRRRRRERLKGCAREFGIVGDGYTTRFRNDQGFTRDPGCKGVKT